MIAKLTLVKSNTPDHPMAIVGNVTVSHTGYIRDFPTIGNPLILWYAVEHDSRYLRTTTVSSIIPLGEDGNYLVSTKNSIYNLKMLKVKFESERREYEAAVNGQIKEN